MTIFAIVPTLFLFLTEAVSDRLIGMSQLCNRCRLRSRLGIFIPKIVSAPMGMSAIRPDSHFVLIRIAITLLENVGERREIPLDLSKITVGDFLPLGFQGSLEL